jgi:hypothetical protein
VPKTKFLPKHSETERLVCAIYRDHVLFHRASPLAMAPQVRQCVGWLVHESSEYVVICWDRDVGPPTLKSGDAKASGLVILRGDLAKLEALK